MNHFTIATVAEQSADFRRVLWTGEHTQLVIMTIPVGGEIGLETHEHNDQILTFVSGAGEAFVGRRDQGRAAGQPGGRARGHGSTTSAIRAAIPMVLYTVYGPPDARGRRRASTPKEEADAAEAAGEDEPPSS